MEINGVSSFGDNSDGAKLIPYSKFEDFKNQAQKKELKIRGGSIEDPHRQYFRVNQEKIDSGADKDDYREAVASFMAYNMAREGNEARFWNKGIGGLADNPVRELSIHFKNNGEILLETFSKDEKYGKLLHLDADNHLEAYEIKLNSNDDKVLKRIDNSDVWKHVHSYGGEGIRKKLAIFIPEALNSLRTTLIGKHLNSSSAFEKSHEILELPKKDRAFISRMHDKGIPMPRENYMNLINDAQEYIEDETAANPIKIKTDGSGLANETEISQEYRRRFWNMVEPDKYNKGK